MATEPKTAMERFVEAMRAVLSKARMHEGAGTVGRYIEAACDAFADAECWPNCDPNDYRSGAYPHQGHRDALRREVFGEP